jgi:hypothetical protein
MAADNRTISRPRGASVTKAMERTSVRKDANRPHFVVMDNLNQALADLRGTVQALYAVDTHINDSEDNEAVRSVLSRLLMADMGMVEDAERKAWTAIIVQKGGAQ